MLVLVAHPGGERGFRVALVGGDPFQLGGAGPPARPRSACMRSHQAAKSPSRYATRSRGENRKVPSGRGFIYVWWSVVSKEWLKVSLCTPAHKYGGGV